MAIPSYGQNIKEISPNTLRVELKKVIDKMNINYTGEIKK